MFDRCFYGLKRKIYQYLYLDTTGVLQKAGAWQPILTRATYSAGGAAVRDKQFFKNLPQ
jgi:hypothetical protein